MRQGRAVLLAALVMIGLFVGLGATVGMAAADTEPPAVGAVTISAAEPVTTDVEIVVTAEVTDASTITSVTADATAFDAGEVQLLVDGPSSTADDDRYSASFTVGSGAVAGPQAVIISATDEAGNAAVGTGEVVTGSITVPRGEDRLPDCHAAAVVRETRRDREAA
jgi:hypothetical protein